LFNLENAEENSAVVGNAQFATFHCSLVRRSIRRILGGSE